MAIPLIPLFVRRWYARAFANGDAFDYASLDAMHADIVEGYNKIVQRVNLISTSTGSLRTLTAINTLTATAAQTAFTVTAYNITYDDVLAFSNDASGNLKLIPPASVTRTSATVVTIPAQTVGATVVIMTYTPGNGTTQLAATSLGQGASLVGINDAGGLITATTVEGALQEIAANLASSAYLGGIVGLTNYIRKDGTITFTANQAMGGFKLTGLGAGTASSNDAARMADITAAALTSTLSAYLSANYLALTGGTLTGALNLGGNLINAVANGVSPQDAATKAQVDLKLSLTGGTMSGAIAMGTQKITGLATATLAADAISLSQAQGLLASFSTQSDNSGSGSFVVPAGITKIRVRGWGGGAGGQAAAAAGSGGGGGSYGEAILAVTAGETLVLTIGAAGVSSLGNGGNTEIIRGATVLLRCQGGQAAVGGVVTSPGGATFVGFKGGSGQQATNVSANWAGAGGDSPCGGAGGPWVISGGAAVGNDGIYPGGGGGGGTGLAAGGNGGGGRLIIDY